MPAVKDMPILLDCFWVWIPTKERECKHTHTGYQFQHSSSPRLWEWERANSIDAGAQWCRYFFTKGGRHPSNAQPLNMATSRSWMCCTLQGGTLWRWLTQMSRLLHYAAKNSHGFYSFCILFCWCFSRYLIKSHTLIGQYVWIPAWCIIFRKISGVQYNSCKMEWLSLILVKPNCNSNNLYKLFT